MLNKKISLEVIIGNIFRLFFVGIVIGSIINQNWFNLFTAILALALTYLPFFIAQKKRIYIPASFQVVILAFIFAAMYLGELYQYYDKFWWWDLMLHSLSGVILGFVGFILVYVLNREKRVKVILSPLFVAFFSISFAVTVGVLWEIFEFSADEIFGLNSQRWTRTGVVDTMWDLIVDFFGGLLIGILGYFYLTKNQPSFFKRAVKVFIDTNKELFSKRRKK
ncbi:hypothetical protein KKH43_04840 [Patescibacteria group bacterium]|nr:hypothetical protein [Patescibacteria group bacterium]